MQSIKLMFGFCLLKLAIDKLWTAVQTFVTCKLQTYFWVHHGLDLDVVLYFSSWQHWTLTFSEVWNHASRNLHRWCKIHTVQNPEYSLTWRAEWLTIQYINEFCSRSKELRNFLSISCHRITGDPHLLKPKFSLISNDFSVNILRYPGQTCIISALHLLQMLPDKSISYKWMKRKLSYHKLSYLRSA